MSNFVFNHDKEKTYDAIGMSEEEYNEIPKKIQNTAKSYIHKPNGRRSRITEEVLNNYSYSEIVLIAATHIDHIIRETEAKFKEDHPLLDLFRRLGDKDK